MIIDIDSMDHEALKNVSSFSFSGAGVQAAQSILNRDVDAVITGFIGKKAFSVLSSKGVDVMIFSSGSVEGAVEAYKANILGKLESPNCPGEHGKLLQIAD